jgi:hypothetical protein
LLGFGAFFLSRFPTADAINSIVYSPYMGSVVMTDHENTIN